MRLPQPKPSRPAENTVSLINIVFLMLIFFLLAGNLSAPPERGFQFPKTSSFTATGQAPVKAVSVSREGEILIDGHMTTQSGLPGILQNLPAERKTRPLKLIADRRLEAKALIGIVGVLRAGGFSKITIVTVRGGG